MHYCSRDQCIAARRVYFHHQRLFIRGSLPFCLYIPSASGSCLWHAVWQVRAYFGKEQQKCFGTCTNLIYAKSVYTVQFIRCLLSMICDYTLQSQLQTSLLAHSHSHTLFCPNVLSCAVVALQEHGVLFISCWPGLPDDSFPHLVSGHLETRRPAIRKATQLQYGLVDSHWSASVLPSLHCQMLRLKHVWVRTLPTYFFLSVEKILP